MTTSTHTTSVYNVEATLFAWISAGIATNAPPLLGSITITDAVPDQPLAAPVWAVQFMGSVPDEAGFLGDRVDSGQRGQRFTGRMVINAYATRRDPNWRAQLAQMLDAVRKTVYAQPDAAVVIRDFYADPTAPPATTYRITLAGIEPVPQPGRVNPDLEQRGLFIVYHWIERV